MIGGLMHGFGGLGGASWIFMLLAFLVKAALVVGAVWLIVWLVKRNAAPQQTAATSPKEALQMRYVRGEITREQYQEMLADLNN